MNCDMTPIAAWLHKYQLHVLWWMQECFLKELYGDMQERGDRLAEEMVELLQSSGYDKARFAKIIDYVYSRPVGVPAQEVGGVMITLAGYCAIANIDLGGAALAEFHRIQQPEVMDRIRGKQASKAHIHDPLPGDVDAVAIDTKSLAEKIAKYARKAHFGETESYVTIEQNDDEHGTWQVWFHQYNLENSYTAIPCGKAYMRKVNAEESAKAVAARSGVQFVPPALNKPYFGQIVEASDVAVPRMVYDLKCKEFTTARIKAQDLEDKLNKLEQAYGTLRSQHEDFTKLLPEGLYDTDGGLYARLVLMAEDARQWREYMQRCGDKPRIFGAHEVKPHEVSDELVDTLLNQTCPGGTSVMAFLPMLDGWTAAESARSVVRAIAAYLLTHGNRSYKLLPRAPSPPFEWNMGIQATDHKVLYSHQWSDAQELEMTPYLRGLLRELKGVIVAAPAKA